jgi:hypothetical protein
MPRTRFPRATGSTLVLVVILLGVLAAIGGAAVLLSSRDRINASAKSQRDMTTACARAAQAKIWAEVAKYGTGWLTSANPVTEFVMPDGTRLGPLHYGQKTSDTPQPVVKDVVMALSSAATGDETVVDLSNRSAGLLGSSKTYRCVAKCTVPGVGLFAPPRELEIEFVIRTRL